ncbi:MAG: hypothetical protein Q4E02_02500 [Lagierella massiliensis]|nr:hypothetical protein [Lagierella massiliensis]
MFIWIVISVFFAFLIVFTVKKKFSNMWIKLIVIFIEIVLILFFVFKAIFPSLDGPKPTGQFKVKTDMVYYEHETKYPNMATNDLLREIPVHVYYPENLEENSYPLFLFSHGSFGIGSSNETLYQELVSQGYIVMSLDHPHHSFFTRLSSGKTVFVDKNFFKEVVNSEGSKDLEKTLEDLNRWIDPRIEDINYVLDKILDGVDDNIYEGRVDEKRIVLSGHSLGGSSMLAVGRERAKDIKALVVLESPFAKDILSIKKDHYVFREEEYPNPVLHIYSDALWDKLDKITTYDLNDKMIKNKNPKFVNKHIKGVGHVGLTNLSLSSPFLTDRIDGGLNKRKPQETLLEINKVVLDFLNDFNK